MTESLIDSHELRKTFGTYPTGIALTAGHIEGQPFGMLTNSFATVSLEPPLVTVSFARTSTTWPRLKDHPRLGISILGPRAQTTANLLRRPTGERFEGLDIQAHEDGSLTLRDADAYLIVELERAFEAGDHIMTLWKVISHERVNDSSFLVFHNGGFHTLATQ